MSGPTDPKAHAHDSKRNEKKGDAPAGTLFDARKFAGGGLLLLSMVDAIGVYWLIFGFSHSKEAHWLLSAVLAALCGINGAYFLWIHRAWDKESFFARSFHELGMALLISCILTFAVELIMQSAHERNNELFRGELKESNDAVMKQMKKNHEDNQKKIALDVFEYTLGYQIDRGIMDEVKAGVFGLRLIRSDWQVDYVFTKENDRLRLKTTVKYKIHNQTTQKESYRLPHYFTVSAGSKAADDEGFLFLIVEDWKNQTFIAAQTKTGLIDLLEGNTVLSVQGTEKKQELEKILKKLSQEHELDKKRVAIKGAAEFVIPGGAEFDVTYEYEKIVRRADMLTLVTTHATKAMTIRVGCDDEKMNFLLDTSHREAPHDPGPKNAGPIPTGIGAVSGLKEHCFWRLPESGALLPGHGIILRWWPSDQ